MKVLILSITAGEGHNSTAAAIRQYFEDKGDTAAVFDAYRYVSKALYSLIKQGYLLVTKDFKTLFAKSYTLAEKRKVTGNSLYRMANITLVRKLEKLMRDYNPDAVIYTHPFLGVVTDLLKTTKGMDVPMVGIVTDYTVHPFWEEARSTDRFVVASELLNSQFFRKGIDESRIAPIGIPVRSKFYDRVPKGRARAELGLKDKFTVLLMGGSMGYGNIANIVHELDEIDLDFQIISVCGNNEEAKERIDELNTKKRVLNYGFTDEISLLMDASDVIVTKPGGLTVSEALVKQLPIIICNPIPGHEQRNATFLLNLGAAMEVNEHTHLSDVIYQLISSPTRLCGMRQAIAEISKSDSMGELYRITSSLVTEYENE